MHRTENRKIKVMIKKHRVGELIILSSRIMKTYPNEIILSNKNSQLLIIYSTMNGYQKYQISKIAGHKI